MKTYKKIIALPIAVLSLFTSVCLQVKVSERSLYAVPKMIECHKDATNFQNLYNCSISNGYLTQTCPDTLGQALAITNEFGGNGSVRYVIDYTELKSDWGAIALIVKGQADSIASTFWSFSYSTNTLNPSGMTSDFIALVITHAGYELISCENGVVNKIGDNTNYLIGGCNGYSYWYICEQKTDITISTTDVKDGVKVYLSYQASGYKYSANTKYEGEVTIKNKNLWGSQCAALLYGAGHYEPKNNNNKIEMYVTAMDSSFNKDMVTMYNFMEELDKINYVSITGENYTDILATYTKAKEYYELLSSEQIGNLDPTYVSKFNTIKDDLANLDPVDFVRISLQSLPVDPVFNRDNYDEYKDLILDARAKYDSLNEDDQKTIDSSLLDLLKNDEKILADYLDIIKYADPVVELISKIELPITNFPVEYKKVKEAKKAYEALYEEEKKEVNNYNVLEEAVNAINKYIADNKVDAYNFTTNKNNFYELNGYNEMSVVDGSLVVNTADTNLSLYPYATAIDNKEVTYIIDANLEGCSWGNMYFIIKADSAKRRHNKGSWVPEGNYTVLLLGGDGFKVAECVNGEIPMTLDAFNNPIADFKTVLDYPSAEEGIQNDIHLIYKNYSILKIKTINLYDNGAYIGYKAIISLTGGLSGKTFTREYVSTNTATENCNNFGLEMYVSNPINDGQGGFAIDGLYIEDLKEFDVDKAKKEQADIAALAKFNETYKSIISDVNENNVTEAKVAYEAVKKAYEALSDEAKDKLIVDVSVLGVLDTINNKITEIEKTIKDNASIKEVIDAINGLNSNISKDNVAEVKSSYEKALSKYNALSDELKGKVSNASTLDSIKTSIENVEKQSETKSGCGGVAASSSFALVSLLSLLFVFKKRK